MLTIILGGSNIAVPLSYSSSPVSDARRHLDFRLGTRLDGYVTDVTVFSSSIFSSRSSPAVGAYSLPTDGCPYSSTLTNSLITTDVTSDGCASPLMLSCEAKADAFIPVSPGGPSSPCRVSRA